MSDVVRKLAHTVLLIEVLTLLLKHYSNMNACIAVKKSPDIEYYLLGNTIDNTPSPSLQLIMSDEARWEFTCNRCQANT